MCNIMQKMVLLDMRVACGCSMRFVLHTSCCCGGWTVHGCCHVDMPRQRAQGQHSHLGSISTAENCIITRRGAWTTRVNSLALSNLPAMGQHKPVAGSSQGSMPAQRHPPPLSMRTSPSAPYKQDFIPGSPVTSAVDIIPSAPRRLFWELGTHVWTRSDSGRASTE